jgi:hypothetical protein
MDRRGIRDGAETQCDQDWEQFLGLSVRYHNGSQPHAAFKEQSILCEHIELTTALGFELHRRIQCLADALPDVVLLPWKKTSQGLAKMTRPAVSWGGIEFLRSSLSLGLIIRAPGLSCAVLKLRKERACCELLAMQYILRLLKIVCSGGWQGWNHVWWTTH